MTSSPTPLPNGFSASQYGSMNGDQLRCATSRSGLRMPLNSSIPMRPLYSRRDIDEQQQSNRERERMFDSDDSDDEIPIPIKFSAAAAALLDGEGSIVGADSPIQSIETSAMATKRSDGGSSGSGSGSATTARYNLSGSTAVERLRQRTPEVPIDFLRRDRREKTKSPVERIQGELERRVVRLSLSPKSAAARNNSLSRSQRREQDSQAERHSSLSREQRAGSELRDPDAMDLNTPPVVRTVRLPIHTNARSSFGTSRVSFGATTEVEYSTERGRRSGPDVTEEHPATVAKPYIPSAMGSVTRYGGSTMRTRYGLGGPDETGLQSSMRVKRVGKVAGSFLSGPARRGKRRQSEEDAMGEKEEKDEKEAALQSAYSQETHHEEQEQGSQEPDGQESHYASQRSSQDSQAPKSSFYAASSFKDFATGSPAESQRHPRPVSPSPPPQHIPLAAFKPIVRHPLPRAEEPAAPPAPIQPYRAAPPRPEMPSAHDQENEAPPVYKSKTRQSLLPKERVDRVPLRTQVAEIATPVSPLRQPLAARSQNTPRRPAPPPPPLKMLDPPAASSHGGSKKRNAVRVNGKSFQRMEIVGRGGSSKVWRVMAETGKVYALKRVSMEDADETAVRGYKGEIDLLKRLKDNERVVQILDWEMNEEKQMLSVLMEMGELDFNKILNQKFADTPAAFDPSFARHYWREMLLCIKAVHDHDIVHSDLKPANFVLVQGRLKLIDFGIANAIQTDETVNVHRDTQIGTPNYMSPESLMDHSELPHNQEGAQGRVDHAKQKVMKLGKPSDIWSLGVILYQMTYGYQPFSHISNQMSRCRAIIDWGYAIKFPELGYGDVRVEEAHLDIMKACLQRDQRLRPSADQLLSRGDRWLYPNEIKSGELPVSKELLARIMWGCVSKSLGREVSEAEVMNVWAPAFYKQADQYVRESRGEWPI